MTAKKLYLAATTECIGIHGQTGQQIDTGHLPAGTEVKDVQEAEPGVWEFLSLDAGRWFKQRMYDEPRTAPGVPFAAVLRGLRESAAHTLTDLGDAAGLSRQRVHQLEAGTHRPSWAEVQALAAALDVSTEVFRDPA